MDLKILIADDEAHIAQGLKALLEADGYVVVAVEDGDEAWKELERESYALFLSDLYLPELSGLELLDRIREAGMDTAVVLITGRGSISTVKEAMRKGAQEYLEKPLQIDRLKTLVPEMLERVSAARERRIEVREREGRGEFGAMLGSSPQMQELYTVLEQVAPSNASVLIMGESGTGKELVAKALHDYSPRAEGPFVALNCGAFPREILENELFGHERGAFTGAVAEKAGAFEIADGGTLFLDEVAEMPADVQVKFLRALEERSFRRLGGKKEIKVDIRVVAATNQDVKRALQEGDFREDLYHRLAVIPLSLPPLRERGQDVLLLAQYFLERFAAESGKEIEGFAPDAEGFIREYRWPGNVRELRNAIERGVILATSAQVSLASLRGPSLEDKEIVITTGSRLDEVEKGLIKLTLSHAKGDYQQAADLLGVEVSELYRKQGLEVPSTNGAVEDEKKQVGGRSVDGLSENPPSKESAQVVAEEKEVKNVAPKRKVAVNKIVPSTAEDQKAKSSSSAGTGKQKSGKQASSKVQKSGGKETVKKETKNKQVKESAKGTKKGANGTDSGKKRGQKSKAARTPGREAALK